MQCVPFRVVAHRKSTSFTCRCQTERAAPPLRRLLAFAALIALCAAPAVSQESLLKRGEDAYLNNEPQQAVALLRQAVREQPDNARIYHYLGVSYQQLGEHEQAVAIMRQGVTKNASRELRASLYLNIGNSLYQLGDFSGARAAYAQAIELRGSFPRPYLNRANAIVASFKDRAEGSEKVKAYRQAVEDYQLYLSLEPNTSQRSRIEQMIALLQGDVEETERRIAERERQEREAEQRRQDLLDSVLNSLDSADKQTQSMSAGQENIEQYQEELDIAD